MVVPKGDERNHTNYRDEVVFASKGNVQISDQPKIIAPMPHSPKTLKAIVVEQASTHIVSHVDTANQ